MTSELVETAVEFFFEHAESEDEWLTELDDRSREMTETGLHLTHEEVSDWLRRLAKGEDVPPPKAHT